MLINAINRHLYNGERKTKYLFYFRNRTHKSQVLSIFALLGK